jgi:heptosyltransferase-2
VRHPVACSPCPHRVCPIDHRCLSWITPDEVLAAAKRQLIKESVI